MENDILYHYCSLDVFLKIIESSTIRLCDVSKMNDYGEKTVLSNGLIDYLQDNFVLTEENILHIYKTIDRYLFDNYSHRDFCFCLSEDGDKLGQWCRYGDDGQGLCIGFSKKELKNLCQSSKLLHMAKVSYSKKKMRSTIQAAVNKAQETLSLSWSKATDRNLLISCILDNILKYNIADFKSEDFAEEREWRLVLSSHICSGGLMEIIPPIEEMEENSVNKWNDSCGYKQNGPKYFARNKGLVAYYDIDFKAMREKLIKKVVIGPKSRVVDDDIIDLLYHIGYFSNTNENRLIENALFEKDITKTVKDNIEVSESVITYR